MEEKLETLVDNIASIKDRWQTIKDINQQGEVVICKNKIHVNTNFADSSCIMKDNSYLINVSRGEVIDNEVLLEYAKAGKFNGIALDVVACKDVIHPRKDDKESSSLYCYETSGVIKELSKLSNVILTPHIAYDTKEAIWYILEITFEGITDCLNGGHQYRVI